MRDRTPLEQRERMHAILFEHDDLDQYVINALLSMVSNYYFDSYREFLFQRKASST